MIKYKPSAQATLPTSGAAEQILVDGTSLSWTELRYDDTAEEEAFFQFQFSDDYDGGNITIRIFWKAAATSGDVKFRIPFRGVGDDDVWDAPGFLTEITETAKSTTEDLNVAALLLASPGAPGEIVQVGIRRKAADAADTMVGDAKVLGLSLEFGVA